MDITITTENVQELSSRLLRTGHFVEGRTGTELVGAGHRVVRAFQDEAPVWRGRLRRSIRAVVDEMNLEVSYAKYGEYVHAGTRPHFPPIDAIRPWAEDHGINPWALAHSIARKGTAANPWIDRALDRAEREVGDREAKKIATGVTKDITKGLD